MAVACLGCVALAAILLFTARPPVRLKVTGAATADIESVRVERDSAQAWRGEATVDVFDVVPTSGSATSQDADLIVLQVPLLARQCHEFANVLGGSCVKVPRWSSAVALGDKLPVSSVEWQRPVDVRLTAERPAWIGFDSGQDGGPGTAEGVSLSADTRRLTVRFECDGTNGASIFVSGGTWLQSDCTAANSRWVEVAVAVPRSSLTVRMGAERFDLWADGAKAVVRPTAGGEPSMVVDGAPEELRGAATVRAANGSSVAVRLHRAPVAGHPVTRARVSVAAQRAASAKVGEEEYVTPRYVREEDALKGLILTAIAGSAVWIWRRWVGPELNRLRRRRARTGGTS